MATETTTAIVMLLDDAPVYADGARILCHTLYQEQPKCGPE